MEVLKDEDLPKLLFAIWHRCCKSAKPNEMIQVRADDLLAFVEDWRRMSALAKAQEAI
jgi:hypothetical protein